MLPDSPPVSTVVALARITNTVALNESFASKRRRLQHSLAVTGEPTHCDSGSETFATKRRRLQHSHINCIFKACERGISSPVSTVRDISASSRDAANVSAFNLFPDINFASVSPGLGVSNTLDSPSSGVNTVVERNIVERHSTQSSFNYNGPLASSTNSTASLGLSSASSSDALVSSASNETNGYSCTNALPPPRDDVPPAGTLATPVHVGFVPSSTNLFPHISGNCSYGPLASSTQQFSGRPPDTA